MMTQKNDRIAKRSARQALKSTEKAQKSAQISEQLLATAAYQQSSTIGAYLCLPEEVNVKAVIDAAWADGKSVFLPVVLGWGKALQFAPYTPESTLIKDALGIDMPDVPVSKYLDADKLDMVVTPLVAFDEQCNRIGMGGGFYDRTFAFKAENDCNKPTLIGVAFDVQRVTAGIAANDWDIRPDAIISEKAVYSAIA